jgi:signal transduction histidine kinase
MKKDDIDYRVLFEASTEVLLVLLPDAPHFTMVAATDSRLSITHTTRQDTIGKGLFEIFPDNPDDPAATGTSNLRASLERVIATLAADTMAVQQYDIRIEDGTFAKKYWSPKNIPLLGGDGRIQYILHRVEDVTELVQAAEHGRALQGRAGEMEREIVKRSKELAEANRDLRAANVKLGELDVAKTTFFSNISHEFRTPLTLMLGPVEDALADTAEPLGKNQRYRVQTAHDNALRLFKLVNTLLDFSRLEAGRLRALYSPIDLASFTAELAGMFRSAVDRTDIKLEVKCPPLSEKVWIDRDMWEKIVPNLISNALKFTHSGQVTVRMHENATHAMLEVTDTGIGIPEEELPRIFDRFHRVLGAKARTHEGTGIGLSLVRELVQLHGGEIAAASTVGMGTTFRVGIPKGFAHLPADAVSQTSVDPRIGRETAAHVSVASRWNGGPMADSPQRVSAAPTTRPHIVIVDDSADLRGYLSALLCKDYDVTTAADGVEGLEQIREKTPDLVISDVMMPKLDGIGLLHALRADPRLSSLPVILLSARAGEESAIDGLDAGSDDYLVKPFSARELLARVRTHIELSQMRKRWIAELQRANRELDAFSYSVSHDLRAPLRAVEGYSRALIEDCGSMLNRHGLDHLDKIQNSVARMSQLIDALLNLSRISRTSLRREFVDLSARAVSVVEDLARANPERHLDQQIRIDVEENLVAEGDPELLYVVLVNLIGNAWKFTAQRDRAHIEVGRLSSDPTTFFVRDNGAGFDMKHAAHLFEPFARLHNANEFSGTGVGLATVQRAVERHGGRIWADSKIDDGATFYFSLPGGSEPEAAKPPSIGQAF